LSRGTLLENGLNRVVLLNEQWKYMGLVSNQSTFLDRVNLVHVGIMGNAFQSWDIAGKWFKSSSCHK